MTKATPFDHTEPTQTSSSAPPVLTDRRGVLAAAVVVAGAGALAACSSPPVPTRTPSSSSSSADTTSTSSNPAASTSSDPATTPVETPAPAGTPTSEIPVGGGKIYSDLKIVVTQPTAGQFKAFSAVCTHQGCTVGQIEGGQIICPCHASHFDITSGAPTPDSQAKSPLPAKTVTVNGATFTVS